MTQCSSNNRKFKVLRHDFQNFCSAKLPVIKAYERVKNNCLHQTTQTVNRPIRKLIFVTTVYPILREFSGAINRNRVAFLTHNFDLATSIMHGCHIIVISMCSRDCDRFFCFKDFIKCFIVRTSFVRFFKFSCKTDN